MFAPARLGGQKCADWFETHLPRAIAWRNGPDVVVDVPPFPFVNPVPLTLISSPPGGIADFDPFEWHAGRLYAAGV
jgi:hypothetical protein